jgi:glycosyltransferase involved in cell wall biosynthesis
VGVPEVRVLHVITGLDVGGTERALLALLGALQKYPIAHEVLALRPGGALVPELAALGVPYATAGMRRAVPTPASLARVAASARRAKPSVVQGWLVHGNLAALAAARAVGATGRSRPPVVWGVRAGLADLHSEPRATRLALRASARWAGGAARIVYNAARSAVEHEAIGYPPDRRAVVPNGFDTARFRPDPDARRATRQALGIPADAPVVGMIARYHAQKDHATFVAAAARLAARRPDAHFLLAGEGVDLGCSALRGAFAAAGLAAGGPAARVHLLGRRDDTPALFATMDVAALSSRTEALPNVVGEAMAAGVVPVVTDVGDVRSLLGAVGSVVEVGDAAAMADAWDAALAPAPEVRATRGAAARARIVAEFGLERVASRYAALYTALGAAPEAGGDPADGRDP